MDTDREDSVIFNTHAYVKKLIASGMPEAQAEAQMEIFIQFIDNKLATKLSLTNAKNELELKIKELETSLKRDLSTLETNLKRDLSELETNLKRDLSTLEINFNSKMKILEKDIVIKLGGMLVIAVSILGTMIKFF